MTLIERLEFDKVRALIAKSAGTRGGKELIEKLSLLKEQSDIEERFRFISEAMDLENPPFYSENNLSLVISSIESGEVLTPGELLEVADFLEFLKSLKRYFSKGKCVFISTILKDISELTEELKWIRAVIKKNGEIVTEEIKALVEELGNLKQKIRERLGSGVTLRGGRYVKPVRAGQKTDGIVHDISRGGKTLFVEPTSCVSLNNEIEITSRRIEEEKKRIQRKLTDALRGRFSEINTDLDIIAKYDSIIAISRISRGRGWKIPQVGGRVLNIIRGRHPLLRLRREVVPLNIKVGKDFTTLLVTGPNMGGKTVSLKTVGLLSLMALSGLPVPASPDSVFPIFDSVFCDMGDESSIESGDSSFSFHLRELNEMFGRATDRSLLLADEIDRGTEPDGGRAIASAFLEEFTKRKALTLASSHSTALKFFVAESKDMQNARMKTKDGMPTYELMIGLPGESLWLHTASSIGIDGSILNRAEQLANEDIMKVESLLRELEEEKGSVRDIKKRLEERYEELKNRIDVVERLKKETSGELKKLRKEKKKILIETRKDIEGLVREIRERQADRESIVRAKREIDERLKKETQPQGESHKKIENIRIGELVSIPSIGSHGRLVDLTSKRATVLLGDVKFELPPESIEPIDGLDKEAKRPHHRVKFTRSRELNYEINLINLRVDEAIPRLQKYIDDLWLQGEKNFRVIHGVGKGILKKAVWEYLSRDNRIELFELATLDQGGDGVTVGKITY